MAERKILSTDLDGVIFNRIPIQVGATWGLFRHGQAIYQPPAQVVPLERRVSDSPLGITERISLAVHGLKRVAPGVKEALSRIWEAEVYGNTGRPNKLPWLKLTFDALQKEGVWGYFDGIFFRPDGVSVCESKIEVVSRLRGKGKVVHFDDNPADALPIAKMFPDVDVVIVQDLTSGLLFSRVEMREYPNVIRVASFRHGVDAEGLIQ